VALGLYGVTLAPGLTWQHQGADGGELVAAAYTLGVAHPPGYPTYLLLGKAFSLLPWGNVAFRLNLMSAVFASGTVLLGYWSFLKLAKPASWALSLAAGAVAALGLATTRLLWSQALIAEVYTLHLLFIAAIALCLLQWRRSGRRWLWLAALLTGLGLGNHLSLLLMLPPALIWLLRGPGISRRTALGAALGLALGLSIYLYLPWRAAQDPPINWGSANTWSGFWWVVTATPYRSLAFGLPLEHLPSRLAAFAGLLGEQFQWWGLLLALVGLRYLWQQQRGWALFTGGFALLVTAYAVMYNTTDSYIYLLPLALVLSWWLGLGCLHLLFGLASRPGWGATRLAGLGLGLLLLIPGVNVARGYSSLDLSHRQEARDYARQVWQLTEPDALILAGSDAHIFSLWYYSVVEAPGSGRSVVAHPLLQYPWYREQLRRGEPGLLPPTPDAGYQASLRSLIAANLGRRPIYTTEPPAQWLPGYRATPLGPLWRLQLLQVKPPRRSPPSVDN